MEENVKVVLDYIESERNMLKKDLKIPMDIVEAFEMEKLNGKIYELNKIEAMLKGGR